VSLVVLVSLSCRGGEGDILRVTSDATGGPDAGVPPDAMADAAPADGGPADAAPTDAAPNVACSGAAQSILFLGADGLLASYDPRTGVVQDRASIAASVPQPECGAGGAGASEAVALAMDRQGAAWVANCDGDLLKCDPDSGLCSGGWASRVLPRPQRMAWATSSGGDPVLFMAVTTASSLPGGPPPAESTLLRFPRLDQAVATLAGWPSLTATRDRLWALFQGDPRRGQLPRLAALDVDTGRELERRDAPTLAPGSTPPPLASFGGDFWVFQAFGTLTVVQHVPTTGQPAAMTRAIARLVVATASAPCGP
jgi:hypothetical protein